MLLDIRIDSTNLNLNDRNIRDRFNLNEPKLLLLKGYRAPMGASAIKVIATSGSAGDNIYYELQFGVIVHGAFEKTLSGTIRYNSGSLEVLSKSLEQR